ncbi:hypothetical protein, partial [Immundisolibacter sp.]|uniref:hypothetical protein n=1 Tax=Immundisolibacter sp. TaxID=1934948 RepID=UPI00356887DB
PGSGRSKATSNPAHTAKHPASRRQDATRWASLVLIMTPPKVLRRTKPRPEDTERENKSKPINARTRHRTL